MGQILVGFEGAAPSIGSALWPRPFSCRNLPDISVIAWISHDQLMDNSLLNSNETFQPDWRKTCIPKYEYVHLIPKYEFAHLILLITLPNINIFL